MRGHIKAISLPLIGIVLCFVVGCTKPAETRRVLEAQGYQQVEITGWKMFGCSEDDSHHTGFRARGQNGEEVSGVACSGWFKGTTLRFD